MQMNRGIPSIHVCSYLCYLAPSTGDPQDLCYFPWQPQREDGSPNELPCDIRIYTQIDLA